MLGFHGDLATSSRRPSEASSRTSSPTNSGLPSVSRWIAASELLAWRRACGQLDQAGDLGHVEPTESDRAGDRLAANLGHGLVQRIAGLGLGVSVGADENDARLAQRAGEELQEQQRRRVGGVQIIEYENDGLRVAAARKEGGG